MTTALVLITNGRRDEIVATMDGIRRHVTPYPSMTLICDDSGDPGMARWLAETYPDATLDAHPHLGHGPAIRRAWDLASRLPVHHVLWMEEDMVLQRSIDLDAVAEVVDGEGLAQMVFKRPAHFPAERAAGPTIISRFDPSLFTDRVTGGRPWLEHRQFYSLNPHIAPRGSLRYHHWPPIPNSEHHFSRVLFRDPRVRVGMWGARDDEPIVQHIGTERTGSGY